MIGLIVSVRPQLGFLGLFIVTIFGIIICAGVLAGAIFRFGRLRGGAMLRLASHS